jgi:hypothetical protein
MPKSRGPIFVFERSRKEGAGTLALVVVAKSISDTYLLEDEKS